MADSIINVIIRGKDQASREIKKVDKSMKGLKSSAMKVGGALVAALGFKALVTDLIEVNAEFDRIRRTIGNFSDSAEEAAAKFKLIQDFAKTTPFQVNEVADAFARLDALGLAPTRRALTAFGNISATTGKSIKQFTEAVADAAVGEFERLKEFNIKASKEGDKVTMRFGNTKKVIENNAAAIREALIELGETEFAGGIESQAGSLNQTSSNLRDTWMELLDFLGDAGFNQIWKDLLSSAANTIKGITTWLKEHKMEVAVAMNTVTTTFQKGWNLIRHFATLAFLGIENVFRLLIDGIIAGWNNMMDALINSYNAFVDISNKVGLNIDKLDQSFGKLNGTVGLTVDKIREENERFEQSNKEIDDNAMARIQAATSAGVQADSIEDVESKMLSQLSTESNAVDKTKEHKTVTDKLTEALKKERVEIVEAQEAMRYFTAERAAGNITDQEFLDIQAKINNTLGVQKTMMDDINQSIKDKRRLDEEAFDAMEQLDLMYQQGKITQEEWIEGQKKVHEQLGIEFPQVVDETKEKTSELNEFMKEAARSMERAFSDFFFDMMQGNVNDLVGNFKRAIDRMVADLLASKLLEMIGGMFTGSGGVGSFFSAVLGRQSGGPIEAGRPYIVGEAGPELVIPKMSGTVLSAPDTAEALGAGNTVNVNITAMDSQDVRRALENEKRYLAETVFGAQNTYALRTV